MTAIPGVVLGAGIVPTDSADTYPLQYSEYGKGGLHTVADETARLAIPSARLELGMLCYQQDTQVYYKYNGAGIWAVAPASFWSKDMMGTILSPTTISNAVALGKASQLANSPIFSVWGNYGVKGDFSQLSQIDDAGGVTAVLGVGAGNVPNGDHTYRVVFLTSPSGFQTASNAVSATVTVVNNTVNGVVELSNIPVSDHPLVTSKNIYRDTNADGVFLLIDNIPNADTTYQDNEAAPVIPNILVNRNQTGQLNTGGILALENQVTQNISEVPEGLTSLNTATIGSFTAISTDGFIFQDVELNIGAGNFAPFGGGSPLVSWSVDMISPGLASGDIIAMNQMIITDNVGDNAQAVYVGLKIDDVGNGGAKKVGIFNIDGDITHIWSLNADAVIEASRFGADGNGYDIRLEAGGPVGAGNYRAGDVVLDWEDGDGTGREGGFRAANVARSIAIIQNENAGVPSNALNFIASGGAGGIEEQYRMSIKLNYDTGTPGQEQVEFSTDGALGFLFLDNVEITGNLEVTGLYDSTTTITSPSGVNFGVRNVLTANPSGNDSNEWESGLFSTVLTGGFDYTGENRAGRFLAQSNVTVGNTVSSLNGVFSISQNTAAGTVGSSVAFEGNIANSVGTTTDGIAFLAKTATNSATLTNAYGLYIENQNVGTNGYGLYIAGASTLSLWVDTGTTRFDGRVLTQEETGVASANNLTLGTAGNSFEITGTTQINLIDSTGWTTGSSTILRFASAACTVKDNQATSGNNKKIRVSGSADYVSTAGSTAHLYWNGTEWLLTPLYTA